MKSGQIRVFALALLLAVAFALGFASCRSCSPPAAENVTAGEPESYRANVVRTIEYGDRVEIITEETARMGELRRHEWSEQGESRVLIIRPDLGKQFLLAIERQVYTETDLSRDITDQAIASNAKGDDAIDPVAIERMFEAADHPARAEVKLLPDQVVEGHTCQVAERRLIFDGRAELIRTYLARDLSGLALKIEMESEPSTGLRFITERRNIRVDVSEDLFDMPPGFKKVDKLDSR
jgi:hypothetical protein